MRYEDKSQVDELAKKYEHAMKQVKGFTNASGIRLSRFAGGREDDLELTIGLETDFGAHILGELKRRAEAVKKELEALGVTFPPAADQGTKA